MDHTTDTDCKICQIAGHLLGSEPEAPGPGGLPGVEQSRAGLQGRSGTWAPYLEDWRLKNAVVGCDPKVMKHHKQVPASLNTCIESLGRNKARRSSQHHEFGILDIRGQYKAKTGSGTVNTQRS